MNDHRKTSHGKKELIPALMLIFLLFTSIPAFAAEGDFVWAKQFGADSSLADAGYAIAVDSSGNSYVTGYFSGTAAFGQTDLSSIGGVLPDVFITKLGSSGNVIWAKSLGGTGYDEGWGIAVDNAGDVYVTGIFNTSSPSDQIFFNPGNTPVFTGASGNDSQDIFVLKLSGSDGSYLWAKAMGGNNADWGYGIVVDNIGGVYITGYFQGAASFDPEGLDPLGNLDTGPVIEDIFISKLNSNDGSFGGWARQVGGANSDEGLGLTLFSSGKLYITGYFNGSVDFDPGITEVIKNSYGGTNDAFVLQMDSDGNFGWVAQMGGTSGDKGQAVAVDSAGDVICTGSFAGKATFGTNTELQAFDTATDIYISKFRSDGTFLWAKNIEGENADVGWGIVAGPGDAIYTTGNFSGTTDFNPSAATHTLTATGNSDIFISKLDSNGNFRWASSFGGTSANDVNFGYGVVIDNSGNIYLTGAFEGETDFDPSQAVYPLTSFGGGLQPDIFVLKLAGILQDPFPWPMFLPAVIGDQK